MRRENISDALNELDERMIEPVVRLRGRMEKETGGVEAPAVCGPKAGDGEAGEESRRKGRRWTRGLAAAACLCLVCAGAVTALRLSAEPWEDVRQGASGMTGDAAYMPGGAVVSPGEEPDVQEGRQPAKTYDAADDSGETAADAANAPGDVANASPEEFVAPESLLAKETDGMVESVMMVKIISVGGYEAIYEGVASAGGDVLAKSLGEALVDEEGVYRLGGHDDLQYVISDNGQTGADAGNGQTGADAGNGQYSLWEFQSFQTNGSYPYRDVLKLIYGVDHPDAIEKLIVAPPTFDNTDEGMRIQKEIGTYEVTGRDDLKAFYEIISGMVCYGSGHWERIDYGSTDISADGEGAGAGVRKGRYLTLVTDRGCAIDRLKYTAVSGMFYEYSGVAYEPLGKAEAERIGEVLGI